VFLVPLPGQLTIQTLVVPVPGPEGVLKLSGLKVT
jgi:hypothetical protein